MRLIFIIFTFAFIPLSIFSKSSDILGNWITEDKEAKVLISKTNSFFYGKIIWLKTPINKKTGKPWLDTKNKDKAKRKLPLLGSKILWGFIFDKDKYINGKVYDSRDGAIYNGKMWIEDINTLKIRGYWAFFFETETWLKVK